MKIASWSGPRNLSTAMMYSFGNRPDFSILDEPFYAAFLAETGLEHPMRDAILASQPTAPRIVATLCAKGGKPHTYQKHMAHHMLADFPLDWAADAVHIHLIRHPARVIASYGEKRHEITEFDLGFAAQATLYDRLGGLILDTSDLRDNPRDMLEKLCSELGLPFSEAMLSWPAGGHPADGIWAAHWYNAVHRSTTFNGPEGPLPVVGRDDLLQSALPFYNALKARKLQPSAQSAS